MKVTFHRLILPNRGLQEKFFSSDLSNTLGLNGLTAASAPDELGLGLASFQAFVTQFKKSMSLVQANKENSEFLKKASLSLADSAHKFPPSSLPLLLTSALDHYQAEKGNPEVRSALREAIDSILDEIVLSSDELKLKDLLPGLGAFQGRNSDQKPGISNEQLFQLETVFTNALEEWIEGSLQRAKSLEESGLSDSECTLLFSGIHSLQKIKKGLVEKLGRLGMKLFPGLSGGSLLLFHSLLHQWDVASFERARIRSELVVRNEQVPTPYLIAKLKEPHSGTAPLLSLFFSSLAKPFKRYSQETYSLSCPEMSAKYNSEASFEDFEAELLKRNKESPLEFEELGFLISVVYSMRLREDKNSESIFKFFGTLLGDVCIRTRGAINPSGLLKVLELLDQGCGFKISVENNMFPALNVIERAIIAKEVKGKAMLRALRWMADVELELAGTHQQTGWRYNDFLVHMRPADRREGAFLAEASLFLYSQRLIRAWALRMILYKRLEPLVSKLSMFKNSTRTKAESIQLEVHEGKITNYTNLKPKNERTIEDRLLEEIVTVFKEGKL